MKKKRKKEKRKSQAVDQRDNPWTKRLLELVEKYVCYEHEIHFYGIKRMRMVYKNGIHFKNCLSFCQKLN